MQIIDVPRNSRIKVGDTELNFKHLDGMYSLSYTDEGEPVHLRFDTEVEVLENE